MAAVAQQEGVNTKYNAKPDEAATKRKEPREKKIKVKMLGNNANQNLTRSLQQGELLVKLTPNFWVFPNCLKSLQSQSF